MKLSLMIQVYNGGSYWKECWESVLTNQEFFDRIFVSISKSPKQEEDIALVRDCKLEKLHWTSQDQSLTAVEHGIRFERWVRTFHPTGHIFILCHDDLLLRDGLLKLRQLDLKEDDAVYGPFRAFSQDKSFREITIHQLHRQDNVPISGKLYSLMQENGYYFNNVSGLVFPVSLFGLPYPPWQLLRYGSRSESMHLCNPFVKRIFQTEVPTVKIRIHEKSEGFNQRPADVHHDTMMYLMQAFAAYRDPAYRFSQMRILAYLVLYHPPRGIWYFLTLQIRLMRLPYYYPEGLKIYAYLTVISVLKIWKLLKNSCDKAVRHG